MIAPPCRPRRARGPSRSSKAPLLADGRPNQPIADAPDVEHVGRLRRSVQLPAQPARMGVQRSSSSERAEAPHVAEELLLLEDALRILCERDEKLVLLRRELH